jgi:hypothetical protein
MDITNTQLKEIILDETLRVLAEKKVKQDGPGNPHHTSDDGTFTDSKSAGSYSHSGKPLKWPSKTNAADCGRDSRSRCHDRELKYEENALLGPPEDESDRMRVSRAFPGYNEMKRLSVGIMEDIDEQLSEREQKTIQFTPTQLRQDR